METHRLRDRLHAYVVSGQVGIARGLLERELGYQESLAHNMTRAILKVCYNNDAWPDIKVDAIKNNVDPPSYRLMVELLAVQLLMKHMARNFAEAGQIITTIPGFSSPPIDTVGVMEAFPTLCTALCDRLHHTDTKVDCDELLPATDPHFSSYTCSCVRPGYNRQLDRLQIRVMTPKQKLDLQSQAEH